MNEKGENKNKNETKAIFVNFKKDLLSKTHDSNLYSGLWRKKSVFIKEFAAFTDPYPGNPLRKRKEQEDEGTKK